MVNVVDLWELGFSTSWWVSFLFDKASFQIITVDNFTDLEKLRKISLIQIQGSLEIYDIVDSRE